MWIFKFGGIMINPVLKAIRDRRSNVRFNSTPIENEKVNAVLEAGRWAPSWTNVQPWRFIVVKDQEKKERMSSAVSTFFSLAVKEAPTVIAVCVNPEKDPFHFIEDGTTATQNMALAAQSIELSTSWIGVFSLHDEKHSTERKLKEILDIPKEWRLISLLPLGFSAMKETKTRKELSDIVEFDCFTTRDEYKSELEAINKPSTETQRILEPVSVRDIQRGTV